MNRRQKDPAMAGKVAAARHTTPNLPRSRCSSPSQHLHDFSLVAADDGLAEADDVINDVDEVLERGDAPDLAVRTTTMDLHRAGPAKVTRRRE